VLGLGAKWARAGRGMVRTSKEAHVHPKGVVDVGFQRRGGADCMWNMYSAQSKEHAGGLCLDHLGCDFSAQVSF